VKALVFTAPSVVELQDIAEPVVGPDEVLVHVAAAGICGSELHGVKRPAFASRRWPWATSSLGSLARALGSW
jgi:threonine dehydrogenase-like Zn-dependent dehydrogenase